MYGKPLALLSSGNTGRTADKHTQTHPNTSRRWAVRSNGEWAGAHLSSIPARRRAGIEERCDTKSQV